MTDGQRRKAHEAHNKLAHDFVMLVVGRTKSHAELMVVMESAIYATMLVSTKAYKFSPAGSVEFIEAAVQQATVRFTAEMEGKNG